MLPTIRAVSLTNYIETAQLVGVDPYRMLMLANISLGLLNDPETRIPAKSAIDLIAETARVSNRRDFGLLLSESRSASSIGAISLLLQHQPTLRSLVGALIKHSRLLSDVQHFSLLEEHGIASIHCEIEAAFCRVEVAELVVALTHRLLCKFAHWSWQPRAVHFTHSSPDDISTYRRVFACPLVFNAGFNGLSCDSSSLDTPNVLADKRMLQNAERLISLVPFPDSRGSLADRVRSNICLHIHKDGATIKRTADRLGINQRALQRGLERERTSFAALLNETKREIAARHLLSNHYTIDAISTLTGYSSQSAFTRWFVAEFGSSPAAWRAQHSSSCL